MVKQLENGTLSLSESMELFKRGIEDINKCETYLKSSEETIEQLIKQEDDSFKIEVFEDMKDECES